MIMDRIIYFYLNHLKYMFIFNTILDGINMLPEYGMYNLIFNNYLD